ncbi:hypothetical protein DO872_04740 [Campylobacter coli]|nr:hypothetical protein [Campylobacter coli]
MLISLYVLYAVKGSPKNEGLVDITEINEMRGIKTEEICRRKNKISIWKNKTSIKVEILFFYKP